MYEAGGNPFISGPSAVACSGPSSHRPRRSPFDWLISQSRDIFHQQQEGLFQLMLGPRKPSRVRANSALSFGPAAVEGATEGPREINHTHSSHDYIDATLQPHCLTKAHEKRTGKRKREKDGQKKKWDIIYWKLRILKVKTRGRNGHDKNGKRWPRPSHFQPFRCSHSLLEDWKEVMDDRPTSRRWSAWTPLPLRQNIYYSVHHNLSNSVCSNTSAHLWQSKIKQFGHISILFLNFETNEKVKFQKGCAKSMQNFQSV